ncbi:MAG: DUF5655 domain-containing protein [Candidatus Delongbacteria bacterium]|jgi:predicted transport protein|nr:DUF5655 domain-containing protein [Candidatus Delongbacteria bacterium]
MALFEISGENLSRVKSNPFSLEKEIQQLTENNLYELFSLKFVKSEFSIKNFRIDSLAYDEETNSFVIIEYKKDKNFSVIDQGYAYLSIMLNNKADFVLEYNEKFDTKLKRTDVEWPQSRVIFVAPSFTSFQKTSINFKDLPIELWEIKRFGNNMVTYSRITSDGSSESINTVKKSAKTEQIVKDEIKVHTEENLLKSSSESIIDFYNNIKEEIYQLDSGIYEKITKTMICFYSDGKGLIWIHPQKNQIKIYLRKGLYRDKYNKIKKDGWGGYPELAVHENDIDLSYMRDLFQQAYEI